ncbi:MAG: hypothetical protein OEX02_09675 [Cyclobacteriaceae bacterium]|nr:hypothetical protein [Cyclobacteriaceae bacterium]
MESLEKDLKDCVKELKKKFEDSAQIKAFEKTNSDFETLVKKGVVQKRGNNLLSPAESHIKSQVWFNTK